MIRNWLNFPSACLNLFHYFDFDFGVPKNWNFTFEIFENDVSDWVFKNFNLCSALIKGCKQIHESHILLLFFAQRDVSWDN